MVLHDVTDRKAAEDALRLSENRFRTMIEQAPISIQIIAPDGVTRQVNRAWERLWGITLADLPGYNVLADPQLVANGVMPFLLRAFAGEAVDLPPTRYVPDRGPHRGADRWVRAVAYPVNDEAGRVREVVLMHEDITEQKRAEDELRFRTSVLEAQGEASIDGILVASESGSVVTYNRRFTEMWGIPPAVMAERSDDAAMRWVRDQLADPDEFMSRVRHLYRHPAERSREEVPLADGRTFERYSAPVDDPRGGHFGRVWFFRDVTDRKRAEDRLREGERHHRELADRYRRLVREVDHRVGNNLAGLLGLVAAMASRAASVPAFAAAIEQRVAAMAQVHRLLAERGWGDVDLQSLVAGMLHRMGPMAPHPAAATVDGPPVAVAARNVPPLAMVLAEWITNSIKYGAHSAPGGAVRVAWDAGPAGTDGSRRVALTWTERGGPPIVGAVVPSLGTELVHGFVTRELQGSCQLRFPPEGADHEVRFHAAPSSPQSSDATADGDGSLVPTRSNGA